MPHPRRPEGVPAGGRRAGTSRPKPTTALEAPEEAEPTPEQPDFVAAASRKVSEAELAALRERREKEDEIEIERTRSERAWGY
jgi:hypothetical protein